MITEDYVSFETAKLLKEKGFDEECIYVYRHDGSEDIWNADKEDIACQKPTLQMAMKWLREVHNLFICLLFMEDNGEYAYTVDNVKERSFSASAKNITWPTYEEACEAGIKYCLEHLI